MSFNLATGPPAPPPLRKSRWSWWKPVKGTNATNDWYYNNNSDSGSIRPGSSSSNTGRPGSSGSFSSIFGSRKKRSSMSVVDDKRAESLRKQFAEYVTGGAPPRPPPKNSPKDSMTTWSASTTTTVVAESDAEKLKRNDRGSDHVPSGGGGAKNNRKSTSRPPPAWYNRPAHHRFSSDFAPPQQAAPKYQHDQHDSTLLSLQERDLGSQLQQGDPGIRSLPMRSSVTMGAPARPIVKAAPIEPPKAGRRQSGYYPPASQDFAICMDVPVKAKPNKEKRNSKISGALQAPAMDPSIAMEALPSRTSRPPVGSPMELRSRRSSSSTTASLSTAFSSRESFESRGRASSWGSQTSFESLTSAPQKNLGGGRLSSSGAGRLSYANYQIQMQHSSQHAPALRNQRPAPLKSIYRKTAKPGELFAALPGEVLELILEELRKLHLQPGSTSCATCWMRDCCSIALSGRKWLKFARVSLYEDVQLVGGEGALLKKRYKINYGARMVLLRRTLRNAPHIAVIVRSLKVPSLSPPGISIEDYHDLVASVVMACPKLERLVGFYPNYNHTFSRLFQALSTRHRLKEMNWIVEPSPYQRQHRTRPSANANIAPGDLEPQQLQDFFGHHTNWTHMTSLTVHCRPGATLTPNHLLTDALGCLSALQTLHLSHLTHTSFNDTNLLSLPPLKKLTLSHLPGVTTTGLSSFATRQSSTSVTTLTLININIDSLPALARIFSNLTSLATFSLVQSYPPVMPTDEIIMLFPYLASASLSKIHWDIPYLPTRASVADTILSRSIAGGGFPSLRTLRAPNDPEGIFQSVCCPRERVDCPADRYRYTSGPNWNPSHRSTSDSNIHSRKGSRASIFGGAVRTPPESLGFAPPADADMFLPRENSDLRASRLAAQGRLEAAKRLPRWFVNVIDEEDVVAEKYGVGAFIGTVGSKIHYLLLPDAGATDEGGGLVGVREMLGDCGEEVGVLGRPEMAARRGSIGVLGKKERARERSKSRDGGADGEVVGRVREGCTGKWNVDGKADRKERERWCHTERGRWRGVTLA